MSLVKKYLRPNVVIEPLIDKWYAWSHLVSPATSALNMLERHIPIMESFISDPDIHEQAVRNPKMKGGPFMDIEVGRAGDVSDLLQRTIDKNSRVLNFARALKSLDKFLEAEAKGLGMEELYKKLPLILRGYVELYYDRNNHADFRLFEPLLYSSDLYDKSRQSVALWVTNNDERPFCLSTPKLDSADVLDLRIPFDHPGIDDLARMKKKARPVDEIKAILGIEKTQETLFESFFTESPPPVYEGYFGDNIRMRYFGHACILIETKHISILLDPLISYYGYHSDVEHFSDADLPEVIDYVLITHNHQDHVLFETLLPLRHRVKNVIVPRTSSGKLEDPDLSLMFKRIGFKNVYTIGEMETVFFSDATVTGLPFTGEHCDLNIQAKSCYLVRVSNFKLIFLADSRIIEPKLYEHIRKETGDVDVVFLGMECDGAPLSWLYGPLMPRKLPRDQDSSRRLSGSDCEKGMSIVEIFHPKEAYVYAMGQEPWVEFISSIKYTELSNPIVQSDRFVKTCFEKGIISERLYGEKEILYDRQRISH